MSLVLVTLLAAAATAAANVEPACFWSRPGHNPFMGDVVTAVDRYRDIPPQQRARLKSRMAARDYDEVVSIQRDRIVGKVGYLAEIRDMHFGSGQVCATVSRARWLPSDEERGLVYCEGDHCILVPTVCRNVSRIRRDPDDVAGVLALASRPRGWKDIGGAGEAGEGGSQPPMPTGFRRAEVPPVGPTGADSLLAFSDGGNQPHLQGANAIGTSAEPEGGDAAVPWGGNSGPGGSWAALATTSAVGVGAVESLTPGVPEPATWALWTAGLVALGWRVCRRKRPQS